MEVSEIATFIFFDVQTTGLDDFAEITELAMVALSRATLLGAKKNKDLPRMLQKLLFQVNPSASIHPDAASLTGKQ